MTTYVDSSALVAVYRSAFQPPLAAPFRARRKCPSRTYTVKTLTRSLDLLHVAASHLAMCTTFVSADDRQLAIAKATGLKVIDIKSRTRSR